MSSDLGLLKATGSRSVDMRVTRFWGGVKKGPCIQLTAEQEDGSCGYIQLAAGDMVALMPIFREIVTTVLQNKKAEAEKAIAESKELGKSIFSDIRAVAGMALESHVWDFAALLCLGKTEFIPGEEE